MIRQLLLALWSRRRKNGLILAEVLISFLVLFGIVVGAYHFLSLYIRPLGFEYENIWSVALNRGGLGWDEEAVQATRNVIDVVEQLEAVEGVEPLSMRPFVNGRWISTVEVEGRSARTMINCAGDDFDALVGLNLLQGSWFGREHDGLDWDPVVVNRQLVDAVVPPGTDPIGFTIVEGDPEEGQTAWRIVGVIDDFRQMGDLSERSGYTFLRYPDQGRLDQSVSQLVIRLRPGTTARFEPLLLDALRSAHPEWGYMVRPWDQARDEHLREALTPLALGATVAVALLLMVALGLLGVLWQSVSLRTVEFGLRRAVGASAQRVYRQVTLELILLVLLGSAGGAVIALQLPLIGVLPALTWGKTLIGLIGSGLMMLLIAVVCAFYPSLLAMRIQPAEALHYE